MSEGSALEKLPPANTDAEQAVLGAILLDRDALSVAREAVRPADFFRDSHRLVFSAMLALEDRHEPVDIVTVADELERDDAIAAAGGMGYIHSLATVVPTAIHVAYYADIVARTSLKRQLIAVAGRIGALGYDDGLEAQESVDRALELLVDLTKQRQDRTAGIFDVSDVSEAIDALYERGLPRGESTGWDDVDEHYRITKGRWTVLTGVPSSGKSEWLDALLINLARSLGWSFVVCSPENQPLERHAAKLLEKWTERPFGNGPTPRMDYQTMTDAKAWLYQHFTFILPDEHQLTVDGILGLAKVQYARRPFDGLVIDPWNELDHHRPGNMREDEMISDALRKLRNFARQMRIHLWLVAHPTKLRRLDDGSYPVPTLYDISGAAHWRNKADNGICIHRDVAADDASVQVHVQKIRFREDGRPGTAVLLWDPVTGNYYAQPRRAA